MAEDGSSYRGEKPGVDPEMMLHARLKKYDRKPDELLSEARKMRDRISAAPSVILKGAGSTPEVAVADLRAWTAGRAGTLSMEYDNIVGDAVRLAGRGALTIEGGEDLAHLVLYAARPQEYDAFVHNDAALDGAYECSDVSQVCARLFPWSELVYNVDDVTVPAQISRLLPQVRIAESWVDEAVARQRNVDGSGRDCDASDCARARARAAECVEAVRSLCVNTERECIRWFPHLDLTQIQFYVNRTLGRIAQLLESKLALPVDEDSREDLRSGLSYVIYSFTRLRDRLRPQLSAFHVAQLEIATGLPSVSTVLVNAVIAMADNAPVTDARICALRSCDFRYNCCNLCDAMLQDWNEAELQELALWCEEMELLQGDRKIIQLERFVPVRASVRTRAR